MEFHLEQLCLNVRVKCPLHIVGCTFEGLRSEVNKHVTAQLSSHLGGYFKYMGERMESGDSSSQQQADQEGTLIQQQQKEMEELKYRVTLLINEVQHLKHQLKETKEAPMRLGIPLQKIELRKQAGYFCDGIYTWRVEKFRDCCQDAVSGSCTAKYSPSFYTSLYPGYNLCMRINLNGVDDGVGKHMALFIHLVRGDHDDFLEWPFAKKFRLSILDQSEDEEVHRHISKILVAESKWQLSCQRPMAPHNYYGMGYPKFAPIELICQPRYTENDTLLVKFEIIA